MLVRLDGEAVATRDLFLDALDGVFFELFDAAAVNADEVVVVFVFVGDLVARDAVTEAPLGGDAALRQELERAVHRCIADARVDSAHLRQQLFDGRMCGGLKEGLDDEPALLGRAQALLHHVGFEHASEVRQMGSGSSIDLRHGAVSLAHVDRCCDPSREGRCKLCDTPCSFVSLSGR